MSSKIDFQKHKVTVDTVVVARHQLFTDAISCCVAGGEKSWSLGKPIDRQTGRNKLQFTF